MSKQYTPDRNDICWLDFEPTKGKEVGKYRPALVISGKEYNRRTGLLICCPISSSIRGAATEVAVEALDKPSVVAASIVQTLAWKDGKAKFIAEAEAGVFEETILRILPIIGADRVIEDYLE